MSVARSISLRTEQVGSIDNEPADVAGDGNKVVNRAFKTEKVGLSGSAAMGSAEVMGLLAQLEPVIRTIARQVIVSGRTGTIEVDDLLQVGRIAALKQVRSFDPAGGASLQTWCSFRITREMKDFVRVQSADVTISDDAQRGRRGEVEVEITITSADAAPLPSDQGDLRSRKVRNAHERDDITPELLFGSEEARARIESAVHSLPAAERELIQWHFGLGVPEKSLRELAHAWKQPRSRLDAMLKKAKAHLAKVLAEMAED
jgi:RNA polymerase sigma factor (sigma-70 family)